MYDIIGDVHGHASLLKKLLLKMGYVKTNGSFYHSHRKAIFVGDFINRGPEIRKSVRIIRSMVESGNAFAILGNHEINAIIYYLKDKNGLPLVNNSNKNSASSSVTDFNSILISKIYLIYTLSGNYTTSKVPKLNFSTHRYHFSSTCFL